MRDFVSRRDGEGGGAGDGTPARVPHVDVPGARAREHRLPVVAHAHARERGRGVLGRRELRARRASGAPRVPQKRRPSAARRDDFGFGFPGEERRVQEAEHGGRGARGERRGRASRAVPRRARVNDPGGAPGGDVDDLDRVGVARRRRHVQAVARPREARERPRDAPAVAEPAPGEDGGVPLAVGFPEDVRSERAEKAARRGDGERRTAGGRKRGSNRGVARGGHRRGRRGRTREVAHAELGDAGEAERVRRTLQSGAERAFTMRGPAGVAERRERRRRRPARDRGRAGGAGPGALADAVLVRARDERRDGARRAPGASRPRLLVVGGGAAKRRVREALPAVDGAGDANQSVRHARGNAARRRRGRRAGLRGRARER